MSMKNFDDLLPSTVSCEVVCSIDGANAATVSSMIILWCELASISFLGLDVGCGLNFGGICPGVLIQNVERGVCGCCGPGGIVASESAGFPVPSLDC